MSSTNSEHRLIDDHKTAIKVVNSDRTDLNTEYSSEYSGTERDDHQEGNGLVIRLKIEQHRQRGGPLMHFKRKRNPDLKVKNEFLKVKLIRGQKSLIRKVLKQKFCSRNLVKVELKSKEALTLWYHFDRSCHEDPELSSLAETTSGPVSEGRGRHNSQRASGSFKSFNEHYCKAYFGNLLIRKNWYYYISLLFIDSSIDELQDKFGITCCDQEHSVRCEEVWQMLKEHLLYTMLEVLDLDPWSE